MTTCPLLQLVLATPQFINANHTSPDGLQGENITFTLKPTVLTGGCRVSVSICNANSAKRTTKKGLTHLLGHSYGYNL